MALASRNSGKSHQIVNTLPAIMLILNMFLFFLNVAGTAQLTWTFGDTVLDKRSWQLPDWLIPDQELKHPVKPVRQLFFILKCDRNSIWYFCLVASGGRHACVVSLSYMTELELHLEPCRCFQTKSRLFLDVTSGLYLVLNSTYIHKGVMMSCSKHCLVGKRP